MDIGAIFLLISVAILTGLFVTRPFMESTHKFGMERLRPSNSAANDQALSSLLAERDRLIGALQELDFDATLGKIPTEDYPAMRANLLKRAADILRQLDLLQSQTTVRDDAESRVEAVIAERRADAAVETLKAAGHTKQEISDDDLEELLAARRSVRKEKSGGFCPNCGKPVLRSDRFCSVCGKAI